VTGIGPRNNPSFPRSLLLLEVLGTLLTWSSSAFCADSAAPSDPAVIARAKQCGSHAYMNSDNAVQADRYADGTGAEARFFHPQGVAVDVQGILYVADSGNQVVRRIAPNGTVTTLAGTPGSQGCSDGVGPRASFYGVNSIAVDKAGTLYVPDAGTNKIRRISPNGQVSTLEVRETAAPAALDGNGPRMSIDISTPMGIAVDTSSNLYVTLTNAVMKISPNGTEAVFAGSPVAHAWNTPEYQDQTSNRDGIGTAARFNSAYGIAVDSVGTVYVTDNNLGVLKSIAPNGDVKIFAGAAYDHAFPQNSSLDGAARKARFFVPEGVAVDRNGVVYVADRRNCTIRKITPDGMVSTLAGAPRTVGSQDGIGAAARFVSPSAIAVDGHGNLYVADSRDNTIRKVTSNGVVTTLAGLSSYRERMKVTAGAPAAPASDPASMSSERSSAAQPVPSNPATRELAVALSKLASQDYVISPQQVAEALNLPFDQFKWIGDGSGGWIKFSGSFDGTAIQSAMLGYRRRMADDGTVTGGQMQAPWRAAYVSLVINMADGTCLSAADVAAEIKITGTPERTPQDVARRAAPTEKSGVEFDISKRGMIKKALSLDGQCARGIAIFKSDFNGEDLPIEPTGPGVAFDPGLDATKRTFVGGS
jgi:sugar lactone lactonase YvrE